MLAHTAACVAWAFAFLASLQLNWKPILLGTAALGVTICLMGFMAAHSALARAAAGMSGTTTRGGRGAMHTLALPQQPDRLVDVVPHRLLLATHNVGRVRAWKSCIDSSLL